MTAAACARLCLEVVTDLFLAIKRTRSFVWRGLLDRHGTQQLNSQNVLAVIYCSVYY